MTEAKYPIPILPTYMGHLLYTPGDLHDHNETVDQLYGALDIGDLFGKDFGDSHVTEVMKTPSNITGVLTYRSIYGPAVNCDATGLSVNTRAGRKRINVNQYLQRISIEKPAIVLAFPDEIGPNLGNNRRRKAFERTWTWFDKIHNYLAQHEELKSSQLYGVVFADSGHDAQLVKMTQAMLQKGVKGIVVGGLFMGETVEVRRRTITTVRNLVATFTASQNVTASIPLLVQGADTLDQLLECLALGVDVLQTNYPQLQMKEGLAFCPVAINKVTDSNATSDDVTSRKRDRQDETSEGVGASTQKKQRTDQFSSGSFAPSLVTADDEDDVVRGDSLPSSVAGVSAKANLVPDRASLNLWQEKYRRDTRVLQTGCNCHACKHLYTRSYIHHLLKARELLADVLLYQHNQHQLLNFFNAARRERGTHPERSLQDWISEVVPVVATTEDGN